MNKTLQKLSAQGHGDVSATLYIKLRKLWGMLNVMTFTKRVEESEVTAVAILLVVTHVQFNVSGCWPN
jgi:hypothetical protein